MEKVKLGSKVVGYPMPTAVVGSKYKGKENFMTVAWLSMVSYAPPKMAIAIGDHHVTNKGIKENKAFSICFPSVENTEKADYVGLVSAEKTDKSGVFDVFYGETEGAPMINEFKLNVELKVDEVIQCGKDEIFIGDIVEVYADKDILNDKEKIDLSMLKPLILSQDTLEYFELGKNTGKAWNAGAALIKK